ncbi:FimD/PapC C-terminal domain-containing protein [Serratia fonticola]|uniref:PapC-like C-terminal domain-containing protein n=1 Tax=Serratia fonticola TaxID=47917 RepID=A0AAW3WTV8_SERFO|nr:hypothetical protein [Serratia fonticola]NYA13606.1 hypothetical protein [Serratia fonticola]NYA35067.1 hypothetical protein [Serratia fonticola]PAA94920.1 hypothetical protein CJJ13_24870 [Serratia fonticola]
MFDSQKNHVGSVGQDGQLYARVTEDKGQLIVKCGESSEMQRTVGHILMSKAKNSPAMTIQVFGAICQ